MMPRFLLPLFQTLVLLSISTGCQHTYEESRSPQISPRPRLNPSAIAYAPIPPDLKYKDGFIQDSGKRAAYALQAEFAKYVRRAYVGRRVETLEESLETAKSVQAEYCLYATVMRWEDHSTENWGIRDKLEIQVQIVEVDTGNVLDKTILKGKSRMMTDGGDTPEDLLVEPIRNYAASFFNPIATPSALR